MITRSLGKTGWTVSAIGFGAWGIGGQWGPVDRQTALDTIRAAYDAGVNFFDTADAYGEPPGLSEQLIAAALKGVRDKVIIATKVGNYGRRQQHPLPFTSPLHVTLCCDASLYRLGTDYIDLYQCHLGSAPDYTVFIEAFEDLMRSGKIRAYGISSNSLTAVELFNRNGRCATVQLEYSILNRAAEKDLLPYCQQHDIGVIVRGPLAKGVLAGKFTPDTRFTDSVREKWNAGEQRERFLQQLQVVEKLRFLERPGRNLAQAALQFVIAHPAVSLAIPGAKSPEQARLNAAAGQRTLDPSELEKIRAVSA
ncbi:aldo/keto reductase [Fontivita pretiosa]|uniref:aldo/keto reductase n=1 Tax=Fontivita pretiosa TaxID=2989684 RepID=UPI003D16CC82